MFNIFRKKQAPTVESPNEPGAAGTLLIVTATTNFGLVVSPANKEPLMFTLESNDSIPACIERNAPYISAAIDVASCLVIELAAHLPNQAQTATNKIFALILPDPGILLNHDMVLVGYEELESIPGPTSSMLQMLVKQVPKEYFAEPSSSLEHKNEPNPAPIAVATIPVASTVDVTESVQPAVAVEPVEPAGFDSSQVLPTTEVTSAVEQTPVAVQPVSYAVPASPSFESSSDAAAAAVLREAAIAPVSEATEVPVSLSAPVEVAPDEAPALAVETVTPEPENTVQAL
jgi:hypothetical protein